jgi:hydrogenase expression/formation protein HypC
MSINETTAKVDFNGITRNADITLVPGAKAGDYVIVHAGYAIEKYDEENAKMTLELLRELADAGHE